jgi:hypothetical protein
MVNLILKYTNPDMMTHFVFSKGPEYLLQLYELHQQLINSLVATLHRPGDLRGVPSSAA